MVLRNHGLLTVGPSIPECFNNMYRLERACELQVTALSCNMKLQYPPAEVVRHANERAVSRHAPARSPRMAGAAAQARPERSVATPSSVTAEPRCVDARLERSRTLHAPWWLPGGHFRRLRRARAPPRCLSARALGHARRRFRRRRLARTVRRARRRRAPLVVLFHGLEGCSASHYAHALMAAVRGTAGAAAVVHFRGCGGEPNRLPRAYHSGDSAEIDWMLRRLRERARGPALRGRRLARRQRAPEVAGRAAATRPQT